MEKNYIHDPSVLCCSRSGVFRLVRALQTNSRCWGEYKKECAKYHNLASSGDGDVISYLMVASYLTYYVFLKKLNAFTEKDAIAKNWDLSWLLLYKFNLLSTSFKWDECEKSRTYWEGVASVLKEMIPENVKKFLAYYNILHSTFKLTCVQRELGYHTEITLKRRNG